MKNKFPLVEVEWVDAMTYCEHLPSPKDVQELIPIPVKTAGYLITKTKDYIVIGMSVFAETTAHAQSLKQFWTIPRGSIKSITYLVCQ